MPNFKEGVYVESTVQNIGTGSTSRRQDIKNYHLARYLEDGSVEVQLLDMDDKPLPIRERLVMEDFDQRFVHVPDYFKNKKSPLDLKVEKNITQAEHHLQRKEYNSAEFEYSKALRLDEDNVRANFGVARVYLATGEMEKARTTLEKLSGIEAIFEESNKHIFNELGIELRRMGMHDQAIQFYIKALSFAQTDENLFFNVARAYFEKNDLEGARRFAGKALALKPGMPEVLRLLAAVERSEKGGGQPALPGGPENEADPG